MFRAMHQQLIRELWKGLLSSISSPLSMCNDEKFVQNLLRAFQSITSTASKLGLQDATDEFISTLCDLAIPEDPATGLTSNHIQVNHRTLETTCLKVYYHTKHLKVYIIPQDT